MPDFKSHSKIIVIKRIRGWHKNRRINRIENPEAHTRLQSTGF